MQDALVAYMAAHQHPFTFTPDRLELVSVGVGFFIDSHMQEIAILEPLMLVCIARWFQKHGFDMLSLTQWPPYCGVEELPYRLPLPSLYLVALRVIEALDETRTLDALLTFIGGEPAWAKRTAHVLQLQTSDEANLHVHTAPAARNPAVDLVTPLPSQAAVLDWFTAFYKGTSTLASVLNPGAPFPALLLPIALDDGGTLWLAIQVLLEQDPSEDSVLNLLSSSLSTDELGVIDALGGATADKSHLRRLPQRRLDCGPFSLVRVVVPLYASSLRPIQFKADVSDMPFFAILYVDGGAFASSEADPQRRLDELIAKIVAQVPEPEA